MRARYLLSILAFTLSLLVLGCGRPPSPPAPVDGPKPSGDSPKVAADDWPWWRGPALDGKSNDAKAPTKWSATENIAWKTPVPGRGHSSPAVCGDKVFLTTADESAKKQFVLAYDRKTGKELWNTPVGEGDFPRMNSKNSHASASPACDGKRVYSAFVNHNALQVVATDLDGKILWQKTVGDFQSEHGYGSSPVLHRSLVIVDGDSLKGSFLAALDAETGKVTWRTDRKSTGSHGNYATPIIANLANKPQLILTGFHEVTSYDPDTGKLLWSTSGPAEVTANTAAAGDGMVFATGGFPEKELLAIRADGAGDVTKSHVAWKADKGAVTYVPSPLYHDGRLYVVNDGGVATCIDVKTGKQLWQERLGGGFTSSPVLVGDLIYATNEAGKTYILKAALKYEVVATNEVGEAVLSTPAVAGGQVFLRTAKHLYCIGVPKEGE